MWKWTAGKIDKREGEKTAMKSNKSKTWNKSIPDHPSLHSDLYLGLAHKYL